MGSAAVNKSAAIAKMVFAVTFLILWVVLLGDRKFASIAFFAAIFVFGFFSQRRRYFWKVCMVFFGLMSVIYSFGIFGGLEPNSQGVLASGNWGGLKLPLFLMLVLSTVLSFFAGLQSNRQKS